MADQQNAGESAASTAAFEYPVDPPPPLFASDDASAAPQQLADSADLTADEVAILTQLDAALSQRQTLLDQQLTTLSTTTDAAAKQALQRQVEQLQSEIKELTHLKEELLAPIPPEAISPATQAADTLHRQLEEQERKVETIHDNRPAPSP